MLGFYITEYFSLIPLLSPTCFLYISLFPHRKYTRKHLRCWKLRVRSRNCVTRVNMCCEAVNFFWMKNLILFIKNEMITINWTYNDIFLQVVVAAVILGPLAWCCEQYHSPKKFIPKLQPMLQNLAWIRYKLKYDDLFGQLLSGTKLAVSIGPVEAITYASASEVSFLGFIKMGQKV